MNTTWPQAAHTYGLGRRTSLTMCLWLTNITYGRYAFTDGRYGFGRTLGRRASDNKILDNLKIAEGVNPKDILDKLSDSVLSMVQFYRKKK